LLRALRCQAVGELRNQRETAALGERARPAERGQLGQHSRGSRVQLGPGAPLCTPRDMTKKEQAQLVYIGWVAEVPPGNRDLHRIALLIRSTCGAPPSIPCAEGASPGDEFLVLASDVGSVHLDAQRVHDEDRASLTRAQWVEDQADIIIALSCVSAAHPSANLVGL
jgi:hypothetical protein